MPKRSTTADWQAYWNERYGAEELVWGREANRFVVAELADEPPLGRALDLACGEGRNSIWLAQRGWRVTGVDFSSVALERAAAVATKADVEIEWVLADVANWQPPELEYALVVIAYLHLVPEEWSRVVRAAARALAPGGTALLIGHALENLEQGWGGPRDPSILWRHEQIADLFTAEGLHIKTAGLVDRPIETTDGPRTAQDTLVRAHRPPSPPE
jgi:SAM-dependent methyltransferase